MDTEVLPTHTDALEANPELSLAQLRDCLAQTGRVRVRGFLRAASARSIYLHLERHVQWRTYVVANERLLGTPVSENSNDTSSDEADLLQCAYDGTRSGFGSMFDATGSFTEDTECEAGGAQTERLDCVARFFSSCRTLDFFREISGLSKLGRVEIHALRFRAGQFVTFNSATRSADRTTKRRLAFYLNVTPEWKPEWGGLLEFRTAKGDVVEAFVPTFNALDLIAFPQGYWISALAPFASSPMLAIAGRVYVP